VTWHCSLGHMSKRGLQTLAERNLFLRLNEVNLHFCKHCVISKQHRLKFARIATKSKNILNLVHSDVWKSPELSLGGARYFSLFIDDYSRILSEYLIKRKANVLPVF